MILLLKSFRGEQQRWKARAKKKGWKFLILEVKFELNVNWCIEERETAVYRHVVDTATLLRDSRCVPGGT